MKRNRNNVVQFPGKRWPADTDPELDPRDFLAAIIKDIDEGHYAPSGMILAFVQPGSDGTVHFPYVCVNLSPLEAAGLAAKMLKEFS